jgi:hypothetical protein
MTDIEARGYAQGELDKGTSGPLGRFLRFALVAIADRDTLIDAFDADSDCYSVQPGKLLPEAVATARKHLEGK